MINDVNIGGIFFSAAALLGAVFISATLIVSGGALLFWFFNRVMMEIKERK